MREFCCGDVIPGCATQFSGKTDDDILIAVARHAADAHGITEVPAEVVTQVRSLIRLSA